MKRICIALMLAACALLLTACGVWGKDATSDDADYRVKEPQTSTEAGTTSDEEYLTFLLELRLPTDRTEREEGDAYPHSTADGELIAEWTIPVYGNTVYESVVKYFEDSEDSITFRLSQHRFYMFHDCTLADGSHYDLETCYIAVDGEYGNTANFQTLQGADGVFGTDDDVKTVTLVYRGWLY